MQNTSHAVMSQRNDDIPNHRIERRLRNMNRKRIGQLVAINAEGKRRQTDDRLAPGPGLFATLPGDMSCVEVVLSFGQMTVMRLDSTHRQDSDLIFALSYSIKIRRGKVPLVYSAFAVGHIIPFQRHNLRVKMMLYRRGCFGKDFCVVRRGKRNGRRVFTGNLQLLGAPIGYNVNGRRYYFDGMVNWKTKRRY